MTLLKLLCAGGLESSDSSRRGALSDWFNLRFSLLGWRYSLPSEAAQEFIDFEGNAKVDATFRAIAAKVIVIDTAKAIA